MDLSNHSVYTAFKREPWWRFVHVSFDLFYNCFLILAGRSFSRCGTFPVRCPTICPLCFFPESSLTKATLWALACIGKDWKVGLTLKFHSGVIIFGIYSTSDKTLEPEECQKKWWEDGSSLAKHTVNPTYMAFESCTQPPFPADPLGLRSNLRFPVVFWGRLSRSVRMFLGQAVLTQSY